MRNNWTVKGIQAIVDSSHDGIIAVDQDARILLVNRHAKKILGLPEDIIGEKITKYIPNSDLLRVLRTGKKEIGDIATVLGRKLVINRLPVVEEGKVVGAVSNFKEITDLQNLEMKIRKKMHQTGLEAKYQLTDIIGTSPAISECRDLAYKFARSSATVLILGESGTGKELFAQGIHLASPRAIGPFVAVNCAALPESLLESELFGYEGGAFTGATRGGKMGLFELAHGGTLFLDEIGEMPLQIQAMLLRVLQERQVRRIGGQRMIPVDVRVIAATNINLEEMVAQKRFRADLFYRLNLLTLELPPLRKRLPDIPLLVHAFIEKLNENRGRKLEGADEQVISLLQKYHWPGNIRELQNVVERMTLFAEGNVITIKEALFFEKKVAETQMEQSQVNEMEKWMIWTALEQENGNKTRAAKRLGIDRSTLWRKLKKYGQPE